ncbi:MAG TPA: DUF305 domain-containing protein [Gemmatimonadaceae bacterium]|nr:DUF305 domain-containing protein [Gemmatimonadaceae bacterium]
MGKSRAPIVFASLSLAIAGCASRANTVGAPPLPRAGRPGTASSTPSAIDTSGTTKTVVGNSRYSYTPADVHFMSAMIGHHSQAIAMAAMAPSHGASDRIRTLSERIINAQQDEIATMQMWLRDRNQAVPLPDEHHAMMDMNGMDHDNLMPGMLTQAQLRQLDASRGSEFDRLFLTFMIRHHRGAVTMVEKLFGTQGAAQDETIFKLANDINVDQTTEIDRMNGMLESIKSR